MVVSRSNYAEKYNEFFWDFIALAFLCVPTDTMTGYFKFSWNVIEAMVLLWTFVVSIKTKVYCVRKLLPIWLWLLCILFSTAINFSQLITAIKLILELYSVIIFSYRLLKIDEKLFISSISNYLMLEIVIQFITYISKIFDTYRSDFFFNIFNYDHYWIYFFGIRTNFSQIFIFSLIFNLIYSLTQKGGVAKYTFYITMVCAIFFIFAVKLSTSIAGIIIFLSSMILFQSYSKIKIHKSIMYGALIFSLIINFTLGSFLHYFRFFYVDFLHESDSFAGRPALWSSALSQIKGIHWLIGNGYKHQYTFSTNPMSLFSFTAKTAHSDYVNVLFCFGIIGLVLYLNLLRNEIEIIAKLQDGKIKNILASGIIAILIMGIPNTIYYTKYMYIFYVYVLFLSYNITSTQTTNSKNI